MDFTADHQISFERGLQLLFSLSLSLFYPEIFWLHFSSILNMTPLLGCNVSAGG